MSIRGLSVKETLPKILAVDFDGTLVTDKYPMIGEVKLEVWKAVYRAREEGYKIILWTCRTGEQLKDAVEFCANRGLHFDAINDNLDEVKVIYKDNARKVFADIYLDDRAAFVYNNQVNPLELLQEG